MELRQKHAQTLILANQVYELHHQRDHMAFLSALEDYRNARREIEVMSVGSRYGANEAWQVTQFGLDGTSSAFSLVSEYGLI